MSCVTSALVVCRQIQERAIQELLAQYQASESGATHVTVCREQADTDEPRWRRQTSAR